LRASLADTGFGGPGEDVVVGDLAAVRGYVERYAIADAHGVFDAADEDDVSGVDVVAVFRSNASVHAAAIGDLVSQPSRVRVIDLEPPRDHRVELGNVTKRLLDMGDDAGMQVFTGLSSGWQGGEPTIFIGVDPRTPEAVVRRIHSLPLSRRVVVEHVPPLTSEDVEAAAARMRQIVAAFVELVDPRFAGVDWASSEAVEPCYLSAVGRHGPSERLAAMKRKYDAWATSWSYMDTGPGEDGD
jgi:hypothetical protein